MRNRMALASAAAIAALAGSIPASSAVTATPPTGIATISGAAPGVAVPAASITPGSFTAQQSGGNWTITFSRTLNFTPFEVRNEFPFQAWAELWEQDESDDDFLGSSRVSNVSPRSGTTMTATFRRTSSQLDTELGGEEIYAKALLKNLETGQVFQVATRRIQISP